jgi:hypothetical protein
MGSVNDKPGHWVVSIFGPSRVGNLIYFSKFVRLDPAIVYPSTLGF